MWCAGFSSLWLLLSQTEHRLQGTQASVVVVPGLSCSTGCEIFPNQGSNPCLLHWQADSWPLSYQKSPISFSRILPHASCENSTLWGALSWFFWYLWGLTLCLRIYAGCLERKYLIVGFMDLVSTNWHPSISFSFSVFSITYWNLHCFSHYHCWFVILLVFCLYYFLIHFEVMLSGATSSGLCVYDVSGESHFSWCYNLFIPNNLFYPKAHCVRFMLP